MIPAEKAKELFDKYCLAIKTEETDSGYFTNVIYAKECALIAVDEILKGIVPKYDDERYAFELGGNQFYWQEVKIEVNKL